MLSEVKRFLIIFVPNMFFKKINPIQNVSFRGCSQQRGSKKAPFPKICHTYCTMMKLDTVIPYLKKTQKINESRDTLFESCWHQHFFTGNQQICYVKKYWYRWHFDTQFLILLTCFWVFKYCLNKHGYNFDDVSKNGFQTFLKKDILK